MNILIVDDEVASVAQIAASINWNELGIGQVYQAYGMQQAQALLEETPVDILLCDIEMPKGTGIELVGWMRDKGYNSVCIFLTCYSRFDYASSAIRLKIFDYVLKPCEYNHLADVIRRAVNQVKEQAANREKQQYGEYWQHQYGRIETSFWEQIINGTLTVTGETLPEQLSTNHMDKTLADKAFYLLLLKVVPEEDEQSWDEKHFGLVIQNIVSKILEAHTMFSVRENCYMVIKEASAPTPSIFEGISREVVRVLRGMLPARIYAYFADPCSIPEAAHAYRSLEQDAKNYFSLQSTVMQHGKTYTIKEIPEVDIEKWQRSLASMDSNSILAEMKRILNTTEDQTIVERKLLRVLYHQLLNVIYYVLDLNQLPVHQPFLDKSNMNIETAFNSIPGFLNWAEDILANTITLLASQDDPSYIIKVLRKYIHENINGDLSRAQLSRVVHLTPDYLSTLFRKKSGHSLSHFITTERLNEVKKLLITTDLTINEIAEKTGYQNISYLAKLFRKTEKLTPLQYRKENKQNKANQITS
jgi:two-component system response regulator YesN